MKRAVAARRARDLNAACQRPCRVFSAKLAHGLTIRTGMPLRFDELIWYRQRLSTDRLVPRSRH